MEHRNISLFRGYSDTESVETSLEEIVNIIKCDAALREVRLSLLRCCRLL